MRSRAVSLPFSCCFAMREAPPPLIASRRLFSMRSWMVLCGLGAPWKMVSLYLYGANVDAMAVDKVEWWPGALC